MKGPGEILLPIRLVMLDMQADKDNHGAFEQTGNGADTAGNPERVKLFSGAWFNHSVELFEVKAGVAPKLVQGKGL